MTSQQLTVTPYSVTIDSLPVLEALERFRVAKGLRSGRAAVCAAILVADPSPPPPVPAADPLAVFLDLWAEAARGEPALTVAKALVRLREGGRADDMLDALQALLGPLATGPQAMGIALRKVAGKRDARGRMMARMGRARTGAARWGVWQDKA